MSSGTEAAGGDRGKGWISNGNPALRLGLCTFGILALELALIRWMAVQLRLFAYFSNMVLMAAFLGLGLGVALGRRRPQLVHWCLPALAAFSAVLAFSKPLGLMHMKFPDLSIALWGAEATPSVLLFCRATLVMASLFWMVVGIFLLAAAPVGWLFDQLPPLKAYSADLLGSFLGVVAMTAAAALMTPPAVWLTLGIFPTLLISRRTLGVVCAAGIVALGVYSVQGARFSPYYRLDLLPIAPNPGKGVGGDWILVTNRDFSQEILDLSNKTVAATPPLSPKRLQQMVYEIPFRLHPSGGRALVVGAGTGNDVAAALRSNFSDVVSVEIDPVVCQTGKLLHPEHPYADPRVHAVVNDARAYFEQSPSERFDVVCYGLLDSHAMFSSMSSLRLENYLYTVEGIRSGWSHVKDNGILSICFSIQAGPWMASRIVGLLREATGLNPVVIFHRMNEGATFAVGRHLNAEALRRIPFPVAVENKSDRSIRIPTDDWPFLHLRPNSVPYTYLGVLLAIVVTSFLAIRRVYGREAITGGGFRTDLFCLGAAFMLLETRMVTQLSLLFGATWVVNSCVFGGILLTIFVVNFLVMRRPVERLTLWFVPLLGTLMTTYFVSAGVLNRLGILTRGLLGGVLYALPIGFAGVIFSSLLKRAASPSAALGSNLLGAVCGGILEYTSMFVGLRDLALFAAVFYLASLMVVLRSAKAGAVLHADGPLATAE